MKQKPSSKEQQVRELDDPSVPIAEMSRRLSPVVDSTPETVAAYLHAKRKGFDSHLQQQLRRTGFSRSIDLFNHRARQSGYEDWSHYGRVRRIVTQKGLLGVHYAQETFEKSFLRLDGFQFLDGEKNGVERTIETETTQTLTQMVQALPEVERDIVESYFFQGQGYPEIAAKCGHCKQAIEQRRAKALAIMKQRLQTGSVLSETDFNRKGGPKEGQSKPMYADGEILLAHCLFKANLPRQETADIMNALWHDGQPVRTRRTLSQLKRMPSYETLRERVSKAFIHDNETARILLYSRPRPIEDGELLLTHVLLETGFGDRQIAQMVNDSWHNNRSVGIISQIRMGSKYQRRREIVSQKYLGNDAD